MSRIDPIRLTEIFRSLSSTASGQKVETKTSKFQHTSEPGRSKISAVRDTGELKHRIRDRLYKLKQNSGNFEGEAPVVALHEVLLWEFGDEIINHVNFRQITLSVCEAIDSSPVLQEKMQLMIKAMCTQPIK